MYQNTFMNAIRENLNNAYVQDLRRHIIPNKRKKSFKIDLNYY